MSYGIATNERDLAELRTAERGARPSDTVMSGASRDYQPGRTAPAYGIELILL